MDAVYLVGDDVTGASPALRTLAGGAVGGPALAEFAVSIRRDRRAATRRRARPPRRHHAGEPDRDDSAALDAASALVRAPGHPRLLDGPTLRRDGLTLKSSIGMGGHNSALVLANG